MLKHICSIFTIFLIYKENLSSFKIIQQFKFSSEFVQINVIYFVFFIFYFSYH